MKYLLVAAYVLTIIAANLAVAYLGPVPVGLGLLAPAGVYFAGLAFSLRDGLQEKAGLRFVLAAIAAGAAISALFGAPRIALASAIAFGLSELADLAVYTPLRNSGKTRALFASNLVGLVVDSALFLGLAFGSFAFLPGQVVGKVWVTLLAVVVLRLWRHRGRLVAAGQE